MLHNEDEQKSEDERKKQTVGVAEADEAKARRRDFTLMAVLGVAHGLSHFFHLVIPPLFPWIMPEFGTSFAQMGSVMTLFFITSSLGQAASGVLVDRFGARVCLYAGVGLLTAAGFLFSLAPGWLWFYPAAAMAGLGNSVFHPADYSIMNRAINRERLPKAFSVHSVVGNIGWAAAPVLMAGIASATGSWRAAAATAGVLAALVLALLIFHHELLAHASAVKPAAQKAVGPKSEEAEQEKGGGFAFLAVAAVWLCFFFFFFNSFAFGTLQNFAPSIFRAVYGLSLEVSTASLTAYIVGSTIGILLGASVAERFQKSDRVIACSMTMSAVMALLLASTALGPVSVLPLMALMGLGVGISTPSRDLLIGGTCRSFLGTNSFGRVYGFTYCGMDVGQTLAPLVAGPLLDAGHYSLALVLAAALQVCAVGTALGVGRSRRGAAQV